MVVILRPSGKFIQLTLGDDLIEFLGRWVHGDDRSVFWNEQIENMEEGTQERFGGYLVYKVRMKGQSPNETITN